MLYLLANTSSTAAATQSAKDAASFCCQMSDMFSLLGLFVTVFKIIIPILLIVFGMLDMGKAVTSGKDDEIKKSAGSFGRRIGAAVVVFFIPTIVGLVMSLINNAAGGGTDNYCKCIKDILNVSACSGESSCSSTK
jgi:hypothetical protein